MSKSQGDVCVMEWESASRQAVIDLLSSARWDTVEKCVILPDREHGRYSIFIENISDLRTKLLEVYQELWYANAPFEGGAAVFRCDDIEDEVIEEELGKYKKFLKGLGWKL